MNPDSSAQKREAVPDSTPFPRISTGNVNADLILDGGFMTNSINIIMGEPGTGKTVFAQQLMFHNASDDRPVLYLTTLSEPLSKVVSYAQRLAFFDATRLSSAIVYDDVGQALVAEGPRALVSRLAHEIRTRSPRIIMIDSFRAMHDLGADIAEARRVISDLAGMLSAYDATTFLLGEYTRSGIQLYPEFAVADSIVELARVSLGSRDERFFRVLKLRGGNYREGQHAFRITDRGLELYPRLVSPSVAQDYTPTLERVATGIEGLDDVVGGGLWRGTTTMLAGPTGAGKTILGLQFAMGGIKRGQSSLIVHFQENPMQLRRTAQLLGFNVDDAKKRGLHVLYASPVELPIDSIIGAIFDLIRTDAIGRVVIDALGDLVIAASDPQRLHDYLYALVQHFAVHNVTSMLTLESATGVTGADAHTQRFSYMSDNVLLLGADGSSGRTLRVIKTRNSAHDRRTHQFEIDQRGARVVRSNEPSA